MHEHFYAFHYCASSFLSTPVRLFPRSRLIRYEIRCRKGDGEAPLSICGCRRFFRVLFLPTAHIPPHTNFATSLSSLSFSQYLRPVEKGGGEGSPLGPPTSTLQVRREGKIASLSLSLSPSVVGSSSSSSFHTVSMCARFFRFPLSYVVVPVCVVRRWAAFTPLLQPWGSFFFFFFFPGPCQTGFHASAAAARPRAQQPV